jgi:addiction module HigA family antidote
MATEMFDPAHPGAVLHDYLGEMSITHVAKHIGVARTTLSRVLNSRGGVSAEMSRRLSAALGTHPSFWFDMQKNYDFAKAKRKRIPIIRRLPTAT